MTSSRLIALSGLALVGATFALAQACRSGTASTAAGDSDAAPSATTPFVQPDGAPLPPPGPVGGDASACTGKTATAAPPQGDLPAPPALTIPADLKLETVAIVPSARHLAALPNGDLLVGTLSDSVYLIPNAEADGRSGAPAVFAKLPETAAHGVTFVPSTCSIYISTQHGVFAVPYADGQTTAAVTSPIARVRQGTVAPNSDGDIHTTTSVAFANGTLYAGVGSSCNACVEVEPTRATIQAMAPDGSNMKTRATRIRNAIAMTVNPDTGTLWAGGAGQDSLPLGHPYEFLDAVTSHAGVADYGWPACEENHQSYGSGADCSATVAPLIVLPAYSTLESAVFYPTAQAGTYAFPASRRGLYIAAHGSWHDQSGKFFSAPRIVFVAMDGDTPHVAVDWNDPTHQWTEVVGNFQLNDGTTRIARPTGLAVGPRGTMFFADDQNGRVYRLRPR